MTVHFLIKYHTHFGESIFLSGNNQYLGDNDAPFALALSYFNDEMWSVSVYFPDDFDDLLLYKYIVRNEDGTEIYDGEENRSINFSLFKSKNFKIIDTWVSSGNIGNVFFTKAFIDGLLSPVVKVKSSNPKRFTHEFRVKAPLLKPGETICLCGSTQNLRSWNTEDPIILTPINNWFSAKVHLEENEWPASYKYGIYNLSEKKMSHFENGENRRLPRKEQESEITILQDGFVNYDTFLWKGAGVLIPVFSLRSKKSFGVGDFTDLKLLIDWAKETGLQIIQLLPVNDTTAHNNNLDSYPYAAISAFALHPLYINLEKIAGKEYSSIVKSHKKKQKHLNALPVLDYEKVMKLKMSVLRDLFDVQKKDFKMDVGFFNFFELNRDWLVPYAVFSYLRDKYKTPDFSKWKSHSEFNESAVQKLASPSRKHYDEIAFYYFVQYHLHLQLKGVAEYAHQNKIILKGDIPIGVYREGCDAWSAPSLFKFENQAGAPPDHFAVKGQNWGFPTYNWEAMQKDNFGWWRKRFDQMSNYFDAFRIDHILGFFRIWSIPMEQVEGLLGHFDPAIPVDISEFHGNNIWFNKDRYCNPFITDEILNELGEEQSSSLKQKYLNKESNGLYSPKHFVDTQSKVLQWFLDKEDKELQQVLFDLISNVILIEEENSDGKKFHFRILMENASSFLQLDGHTQQQLQKLYVDYFYRRQNDLWRKEAMKKLPALKRSTNMLVCGEDLGMVPDCVPEVMKQLGILGLDVERMPKDSSTQFFHPGTAQYLSVVTPSTHDMSTIRGWWEEDRETTQYFYNYMLGHYGEAPFFCEGWINKEIVMQNLYTPAMWSIFLWQDLVGIDDGLRRKNPNDERINIPAISGFNWNYRMHIDLEKLLKEDLFNQEVKTMVEESGRGKL